MIRRDFCKSTLALAGLAVTGERASAAAAAPAEELAKAPGLTKYVSEFIVNTKYEDIPANVIELGKKTILDGFGLALAGSASTRARSSGEYIDSLGLVRRQRQHHRHENESASALRRARQRHLHPRRRLRRHRLRRFHVRTRPCCRRRLRCARLGRRSGKDLMLAYHVGVEVGNKIGEAISPRHYSDGFTPPARSAPSAAPPPAPSCAA